MLRRSAAGADTLAGTPPGLNARERRSTSDPGAGGPSRSVRLVSLGVGHLLVHTLEQGLFAALVIELVQRRGLGLGVSAALQALQALPLLLLALPLGAMADRGSKGRIVGLAEALRLCVYACVVFASLNQAHSLSAVVASVLALLLASASAAHAVCVPALLPLLVDTRGALARANSWLERAKTLGYAGGPALFGVAVSQGGLATSGMLACGLGAVSATLLWVALAGLSRQLHWGQSTLMPPAAAAQSTLAAALDDVRPSRGVIAGVVYDVRAGWAFVRSVRVLADVYVAQAIFSVCIIVLIVALVPHASAVGLGTRGTGALAAVQGVGMLAGASCAPWFLRRMPLSRALRLSSVLMVLAGAAMVLAHSSGQAWLSAAGLFLAGFGPMVWTVGVTTLRQISTPAPLQGRVAAFHVLTLGLRVVGAAVGGLVGVYLGAEACLWLSLALGVAFAGVAWRSRAISEMRDVVA